MTTNLKSLSAADRISVVFLLVTFVLMVALKLATLLVTILFSYLVLNSICWRGRKWLAILLFAVLFAGLFTGFVYFIKLASKELPRIVETAIPMVVDYANRHNFELPFTDVESLKDLAVENVKGALSSVSNFAKLATKEFIFLIMGFVVAAGVFLNPKIDPESNPACPTLYSEITDLIAMRFGSFYRSFKQVMFAQLTISAINTTLTSIFVYSCGLKYASLIIVITFLLGLLPIIGNILSNTIIVSIGFTHSPGMALSAFVFLVVIHKLEYFLNSKIVGDRIRHPMWLMLISLVVGEHLMGIPGIILAPTILSFIKKEASQISPPSANDQVLEEEKELLAG